MTSNVHLLTSLRFFTALFFRLTTSNKQENQTQKQCCQMCIQSQNAFFCNQWRVLNVDAQLKAHWLYSKPQVRKQHAFNRFPKTLFVLSFELNTAQPMRAMCIQSSPQDAIFDYLLNCTRNNMIIWQSIWSKLASWTYSGITLDIKVFSLWRTS